MKWLKRGACLALVLLWIWGAGPARAQEEWVTVAVPTQMSGCFFSDMWGNNSVDLDIRAMLHGYDTVCPQEDFAPDPTVVKRVETAEDERGVTYTLTLASGLTYNDGTPITAGDYVFSLLLGSSPAVAALGGVHSLYSHVEGWAEYASGRAATLSGVRLLDERRFSITVSRQALPYYYGWAAIRVRPAPAGVIAPGYGVGDDGAGGFLYALDGGTPTPAHLDPELLRETPPVKTDTCAVRR